MPRAMLTFHLPREKTEFELAQAAPDLARSLSGVVDAMRRHRKDHDLTQQELAFLDRLREEIDFETLDRVWH